MTVMDKFKLQGKVALVTGAGRNLGKEIALTLAEAGADVVVTSRTVSEIEKTVEEIKKKGRRALAILMDITNFSQVEQGVHRIVSEFGRIDVLVNNAATRSFKSVLDISPEEWRSVIDTNLTGPLLCCKAVGPFMIRQGGGRVINISSKSGLRGRANRAAYCASKGGLIQLTRALAVEWAPYNILVNAIAPGMISADLGPEVSGASREKRIAGEVPLKRIADLSEIVPLILYLAAEAGSYMTGEVILIDGGMAAQ
jgi:NAD(P)-dependent dehydrogenase (short-subunit alcohol dehydrogenase family)